jgi:hypothetical protein
MGKRPSWYVRPVTAGAKVAAASRAANRRYTVKADAVDQLLNPPASLADIAIVADMLKEQGEIVRSYFEHHGSAIIAYCRKRWGWAKPVWVRDRESGRGSLMKNLNADHHALEVAGGTFIKAVTTRSHYRGNPEAMLPWLKMIAERVAKDLRKKARYETAHLVPIIDDPKVMVRVGNDSTGPVHVPLEETIRQGQSATDRALDRQAAAERARDDQRQIDVADRIARAARTKGWSPVEADVLRLLTLEVPPKKIADDKGIPYRTIMRWKDEAECALGVRFPRYRRQ